MELLSGMVALGTLLLCGVLLGRGLPRWWRAVPVVTVLCGLGMLGWQYRLAAAGVDNEIPPRPDENYVQSQGCAACHADHFNSWKQTYHRTMTQEPTDETVLGDFNDRTVVTLGHTFRMFRQGRDFMMEVDDRQGRLRAQVRNIITWPVTDQGTLLFKVDRLLGSHNLQAYLTRLSDGRIILLPLYWHPGEKTWLARTAAFLVPPGEGPMEYTALWNASCVLCHNTRAHPGYIVQNGRDLGYDTTFKEMGVACESCHGPGERHAELNKNPLRRYAVTLSGGKDPSIVSPARMTAELSVEMCGRCHGKWHSNEHATMLRHQDEFIPGMRVSDKFHNVFATQLPAPQLGHTTTMEPRAGFFWPDWTPQTTAMEHQGTLMSACNQKGGMTCLHCHSMHKSHPDNQLKVQDDLAVPHAEHNASCTQCHTQLSSEDAVRAHSHHAPEGSGGRCVSCHMPYQGYGLLKAVRSHRITVPSVELTAKIGLSNACNTCHLDKSLQWSSEHMTQWWNTPPVELDEVQREVPATLVDLLKGHALQRALALLTLKRAAETGDPWVERTAPLILDVMRDEPYHAVRLHAFRALRAQERFKDITYDYMADDASRRQRVEELRERLRPSSSEAGGPELVEPVKAELVERLRRARDNRDIFVEE